MCGNPIALNIKSDIDLLCCFLYYCLVYIHSIGKNWHKQTSNAGFVIMLAHLLIEIELLIEQAYTENECIQYGHKFPHMPKCQQHAPLANRLHSCCETSQVIGESSKKSLLANREFGKETSIRPLLSTFLLLTALWFAIMSGNPA